LKKNQDNCVSEAHDRICLAGAMVLGGRHSQLQSRATRVRAKSSWRALEEAPNHRDIAEERILRSLYLILGKERDGMKIAMASAFAANLAKSPDAVSSGNPTTATHLL
jgi:hypothetical protein